jgi:hypothetical protein
MPSKVNKAAKEKQTKEEVVQKILAPGGRKSSLRNTKRMAAETPPREDTTKAVRPTGTSPRKKPEEDNLDSLKDTMSLDLATAKSDPSSGESSAEESKGGNDSIKAHIAAVQANLFKGLTQDSAEQPEEDPGLTVKSGKKKGKGASWVHVAKVLATPSAQAAKRGANFAEGTQFNEKQHKPVKKTPRKQGESELFTSVIRIKIKLFHGVPEVQAAIIALLDYCLTTLQERDKHAQLLSRNKNKEAFRAKDFPQDFTDFYDEWGLWDDRTQSFLNTIPEGKSRSFSASFWFKCKMLPKVLFEKTFLKMAGQKKLKGSIVVEMKPCQHLDTAREIIFFQVPNCDAIGLQDML